MYQSKGPMAGLCSAGGGSRQEVGGAGVGAARVVEAGEGEGRDGVRPDRAVRGRTGTCALIPSEVGATEGSG